VLIDAALDAIKTRLETIDGLTVTTDPGVGVVPPMARVMDGQIEYHSTFARGYDQLNFTVTLYVSRADSAEGALEARDYKSGHGSKSVRSALETGTDAGLEAVVVTTGEVGTAEAGGESYITLQVQATAQLAGKE